MFRKVIASSWWLVLAALLGGGAFFAAHIPRLHINASTDAFIEEEESGLATYYETREDWGSDEYIIISLTSDAWFTPEGLSRLRAIEAELAGGEWVSHTMSVLDVPLLRQEPVEKGSLRLVRDLMTGKLVKFLRDDDDVDLAAARAELIEHEMAAENLITPDGRSVSILVYLSWEGEGEPGMPDADERRQILVDAAHAAAEKWGAEVGGPIWVSGIPFINRTLFAYVRQDMIVFGIASLLIFTLAFLAFFRRLRFVVLPMLCCLLPAAGMVGAMALFGIPIAIVTSNMPVLLFVLMLPYNVYFIERYRERRRSHPDEDGLDSTIYALRQIAMPCVFSCATTVAGFAALSTSPVIPIRDFGQLMTVGMVVGFVSVFLFLPASMRPLRGLNPRAAGQEKVHSTGRLVRLFQNVALARPVIVVVIAAAVLAGSLFGALRISAENKFTDYFWPGSDIYKGLRFIDQNMGGTTWIEVILSSGEEGTFDDSEGLSALDTVEAYFDDVPESGNILSLTSLRDEMRKTLPADGLLALSDKRMFGIVGRMAPELIEQVSDSEFKTGRTTIRMKETSPTLNRNRILAGLDKHIEDNAEMFEGMEVEVTGIFPVYAELLNTLIEGQKSSLIWVPLSVYAMLLVLFRSPVLALLVLIPQALPVTVLLGVMGWAGIPLDLVTVMIASIAIGVGIDAAIQYTMRFRAELAKTGGDHREAIRRAHSTTGRAIWIATSIIVAGFAILVLSRFFPSVWFGMFTALAMLISQLATLTLLPSLFLLTGYPRARKVEACDPPLSRSPS